MENTQSIFIENKPGNPWLIFLHGFCEGRSMWHPTVQSLGKAYNYAIPDLPGFGGNAEVLLDDLESVSQWVWDNAAFAQENPIHLIGHSMGGYISLEMAKKHPERVKSISLVHSTASADDDEKKANREKGVAFLEKHGLKPYLKEFVKNLLGHQNQPKHIVERIAEIVSEGAKSKEGIIHALRAMGGRSSKMDFIRKTEIPIQYFIGKSDAFIPYRKLQIEALQIKNATVSFLEDSTHIGFLEQSEFFIEELQAFLRKNYPV